MTRIALPFAAVLVASLTACTPSNQPAAETTTTTEPAPVTPQPAPDAGMPATASNPADNPTNPNVSATDLPPANETQMTPTDPTPMPKRAANPSTGASQPAPPPIEDPAPTSPPTQ